MAAWALWAVCLGLLFLRGLFGAAESALYATSDIRARELSKAHPRRGQRLMKLKLEREATAASVRFGMVLSGFTAAAIGAMVPPQLLNVSLEAIGATPWLQVLSPLASALLVACVAAMLDVTFRAAAAQQPEGWALLLSGYIRLAVVLLYPVIRSLIIPINLVLRVFGTKVTFEAPPPPLEELEKLLAAQAAKHEVDKGAPALIRSIFELSDKTVRDVMVTRTEVVAVSIDTPPKEILQLVAEQNHSRIPVYKDDVDHIVGILHVRDLVPLMQAPELIVLSDLVRPAVYVPWVKPIGDLLRELQRLRIHMAVVVDEYGGFMGIVTLEDILTQIVGRIGDEFTEEAKPFEKQADGTFLIDATLEPKDFAKAFEMKLPDGEFETVGGFLSSLAGAIPEVGDKFFVNGWTFAVHSKQGPKLERIKVMKPKPPLVPAPEKKEITGELMPRASPVR